MLIFRVVTFPIKTLMLFMSFPNEKEERDGRMLLNSVPGIGPVLVSRLMERFGDNPWEIISAKRSELKQVLGVGDQIVDSLGSAISSDWLDKEKAKLDHLGAKFVHGNGLPEFLTELPDPPIGLYCLGEIPALPCLSVVGTRVPSLYGKKLARKFASELASSGICIVSGMARGIDSEAHWGALEAGGKTIAFMGSGMDVIYPPENLELYRKIQNSGAVLSEFPLGRRADRRTFPMRNRLVAGVSLGVLVVESAKSGGSMITAKFAAEQGRTVFAVPGRVDQPESQGCLDLLRDGATLVRNTNDILEELAPMLGNSKFSDQLPPSSSPKDLSDLDKDEQAIMKVLTSGEILGSEKLQEITKIPLPKITLAITMLEIRGLVTMRPDGKYEAT